MTPAIEIRLEGGDRVSAHWDGKSLATDQDGTAPAPFDLFLASIGTCVGFYVARFCARRSIEPQGIGIVQRVIAEPEGYRVARIEIEVALPPGFPERYREAVLRAAAQCAVKQHLERAPDIEVLLTPGVPV